MDQWKDGAMKMPITNHSKRSGPKLIKEKDKERLYFDVGANGLETMDITY